MSLLTLEISPEILAASEKLQKSKDHLEAFLQAVAEKSPSDDLTELINTELKELNNHQGEAKALRRQILKKQNKLINLVMKQANWVPKHYYRNLWLVLGMSTFGVPIGVSAGLVLDNMGLLGLGLPIGMAIGLALGAAMDQKAQQEDRVLDFQNQL